MDTMAASGRLAAPRGRCASTVGAIIEKRWGGYWGSRVVREEIVSYSFPGCYSQSLRDCFQKEYLQAALGVAFHLGQNTVPPRVPSGAGTLAPAPASAVALDPAPALGPIGALCI